MLGGLNSLLSGLIAPINVARPSSVNIQEAIYNGSQLHGRVPYQAPVPYTGGRVKALFVGINYAGTSNQLSGCVNDVFTMLSTLQRITFPITESCVLVDDPCFPNFIDYPTRDNMIRYMGWLVAGAKAGDVLFFHYSGHGGQTRSKRDTEEEYDQSLCPVDFQTAGTILDDDLFLLLCRSLPAGVRLTCVFDCCHSASMLDLPFSFVASHQLGAPRSGYSMHMVRRDNFAEADVLLFSGCTDDGTSADVQGGPSGAGGAATQAFTWCLENTGGLNYMDILLRTRNHLKSLGYKQVPQLTSSKPVDLSKTFSLFGSLITNEQQLQQNVPPQFRVQPSQPVYHFSLPPPGSYPRPAGPYGGNYQFSGPGYVYPGGPGASMNASISATGQPIGSYPHVGAGPTSATEVPVKSYSRASPGGGGMGATEKGLLGGLGLGLLLGGGGRHHHHPPPGRGGYCPPPPCGGGYGPYPGRGGFGGPPGRGGPPRW